MSHALQYRQILSSGPPPTAAFHAPLAVLCLLGFVFLDGNVELREKSRHEDGFEYEVQGKKILPVLTLVYRLLGMR